MIQFFGFEILFRVKGEYLMLLVAHDFFTKLLNHVKLFYFNVMGLG